MSSQQTPLFIKIKYRHATRKVRLPSQPAPVWSKLSAAINDRFAIPENQPIGLEYLDPDGDLITISSQVEFDELWHEIILAANLTHKDGTDRRTLRLELVLIDSKPPEPPEPNGHVTQVGLGFAAGLTPELAPTLSNDANNSPVAASAHLEPIQPECNVLLKEQSNLTPSIPAPDPPEYPINTSSFPERQASPVDSSLGLAALITAIDAIAPKLQDTLGGYAQMIAKATGQLSDTCRVISDHLQERPTHPAPSHYQAPPTDSHTPGHPSNPPVTRLDSLRREPPIFSKPITDPTARLDPPPIEHPFFSKPASNPTRPPGHFAPLYPMESTQRAYWPTRSPLAFPPVPKPNYPFMGHERGYTSSFADKSNFGAAGFRNVMAKDRSSPVPSFAHEFARIPEQSPFGLMGWEAIKTNYRPVLAKTCGSVPAKTPWRGLGLDTVRQKEASRLNSSPAANSAISPQKGELQGVGTDSPPAIARSSFTPILPNKHPSSLDKSSFVGPGDGSVFRDAYSPSLDRHKNDSPDFSLDDSWPKPDNYAPGSPVFKDLKRVKQALAHGTDLVANGNDRPEPSVLGWGAGASEKKEERWGEEVKDKGLCCGKAGKGKKKCWCGWDHGGAEKKKGPASWVDPPEWNCGWDISSKFSRHPASRQHPIGGFPDAEDSIETDSQPRGGLYPDSR
ncbi:hypothetical protein VP01_1027g1 [Puccinia sorghi]|uniref:PB1 domain-containing protein n=1 Tax=Puccinia sorghi TaxID=27349 RepID=A0A0L6VUN4_9BASI|nr:hypothetical protein VP01_1027g1 [Puccinia sorghi]